MLPNRLTILLPLLLPLVAAHRSQPAPAAFLPRSSTLVEKLEWRAGAGGDPVLTPTARVYLQVTRGTEGTRLLLASSRVLALGLRIDRDGDGATLPGIAAVDHGERFGKRGPVRGDAGAFALAEGLSWTGTEAADDTLATGSLTVGRQPDGTTCLLKARFKKTVRADDLVDEDFVLRYPCPTSEETRAVELAAED